MRAIRKYDPGGIRTPDLSVRSALLYLLSYEVNSEGSALFPETKGALTDSG